MPFRAALALTLIGLLSPVAQAGASGQPRGSVRLSDGRTFSHWAHAEREAPIRLWPTQSSRRVASTHALTEDGFPEVYPALRRFTTDTGKRWVRVRVPMRPNGRTGWVRASALGPLYRSRTRLVVNRRRLRATLYESGRPIWRSRVGIGAPGTPTPTGFFWIREKFEVTYARGVYGPRAFGTGAYSRLSEWPGGGVIGIHGTGEPWLIPGRPSHGCVRLPNRAIRRLYRLMPVGTPLWILP
jgi:hypothetical protein